MDILANGYVYDDDKITKMRQKESRFMTLH